MPERLLILGGTGEAVALAKTVAEMRPDLHVITSLAGVTRSPRAVPGEVRIGGFGGIAGLTSYLLDMHINWLIDATHPFAAHIADHAVHACADTGVPCLKLLRPMWQKTGDDIWIEVGDAAEAAAALGERGAKSVFLTLGIRDLDRFVGLDGMRFVVRLIERPAAPLPLPATVVIGRGPFAEEAERELMTTETIDAVIAKASGGKSTEGKILAARTLGLPVVMIRRPAPPAGAITTTVSNAFQWLDGQASRATSTP